MLVKSKSRFVFHHILILLSVLLAGQTIATVHAIEHGFQNDDEICFVCDAADNFQNTLNVDRIPEYEGIWQHDSGSGIAKQVDCCRHYFYPTRGPPQLH